MEVIGAEVVFDMPSTAITAATDRSIIKNRTVADRRLHRRCCQRLSFFVATRNIAVVLDKWYRLGMDITIVVGHDTRQSIVFVDYVVLCCDK